MCAVTPRCLTLSMTSPSVKWTDNHALPWMLEHLDNAQDVSGLLPTLLLGLSCGADDLTVDAGHGISLELSRMMRNVPVSTRFTSGRTNKCPLGGRIRPSLKPRIRVNLGTVLFWFCCLLIFWCWGLKPEPRTCQANAPPPNHPSPQPFSQFKMGAL